MQKLFDEVNTLDERCYNEFGLNEDILMEHAANGIANFIRSNFSQESRILIVSGSGNNGADGLTLARLLHRDYKVEIYYAKTPTSQMGILQMQRVHAIGVSSTSELKPCDVVVDALFGTGFKTPLKKEMELVLQAMNKLTAYKIACDIPSGIMQDGLCHKDTFEADTTLTMGALKKSMYSDTAKDFVGKIQVLDLGIARSVYEKETSWNVLDSSDLELPTRAAKNTHKGSYGHLAVLAGNKTGAGIMSGLSALKFGAGLVTIVSDKEPNNIPYSMMHSPQIPTNTSALAFGMGLGVDYNLAKLIASIDNSLPLIGDADIFSMPDIVTLLQRDKLVLTPHPKEFVALLQHTKLASITVEALQNDRFTYAELFCTKYPDVTLLLKGANVIIGQGEKFFINANGTSALAKGGSGDVLSGLIGALLAQGYSCLHASIHASLAHTQLAQDYQGTDFSLTPSDLIQAIGNL